MVCLERTGELDGDNDDYDAFDRDDGFQGRGGHDGFYGPADRADFLDWAGSDENFLSRADGADHQHPSRTTQTDEIAVIPPLWQILAHAVPDADASRRD